MSDTKRRPVELFFNNGDFRGPGKVVQNLEKGLELIGVERLTGSKFLSSHKAKTVHFGCLQDVNGWGSFPANTLMGPNLFVLPSDWGEIRCRKFQHYVVPSKWVHDLYRRFPVLDHATIDIWSVGIDTEKWSGQTREVKTVGGAGLNCLLYYKNRTSQDLEAVRKFLQENVVCGDQVRLIEYGKYTEEQLMEACRWANFAVLLTDTESQGIAYMEMLSTDLPCFVLDKWFWDNDGKYQKVSATSVPYFDNRCGEVSRTLDKNLFMAFIENVRHNKYSPREFIINNHTLEKSAELYYSLLEKYQTK